VGLAVRIIPTLLAKGPRLVKGRRFSADRVVGHVQQAARIHQARGVDELCILDVAATPEGRGPDFAAIRKLTEECFMPLTVGGGVRSVEDVKGLLDAGADKVAIKTNIDVGYDAAKRYGSQALVAVMDELPPYHLCDDVACAWADLGYGEILLTSIEREGTMEGYDLELIHLVANVVDIPVIAHGGCSGYEDMYNAIQAGASAVAAGALFQFTDCTPRGAAEYLSSKGVEVRL
jgi:cyclase